jgi:hypothetical protein
MYAAPVWSPSLKYDVNAVERVQRRFTKKLAGMGNLSYPERLNVLHALSLEKERLVADVVLLHRCMHGKSDYKLSDIGVALSNNNERSGKVRLEQCQHALYISRSLFHIVPSENGTLFLATSALGLHCVVLNPNYIHICYLSDLLPICVFIYYTIITSEGGLKRLLG